MGADAVLVSGCHPGDCHYTAGNYHARRRWMLFRELLETLGIDLRAHPLHLDLRRRGQEVPAGRSPRSPSRPASWARTRPYRRGSCEARASRCSRRGTRARPAARLLEEGTVKVVIGYGQAVRTGRVSGLHHAAGGRRAAGLERPVLRQPDDVPDAQGRCERWASRPSSSRAATSGRWWCWSKESQIDRGKMVTSIGMACDGVAAEPQVRDLRRAPAAFADVVIGEAASAADAGRAALRATSRSSWKAPAERHGVLDARNSSAASSATPAGRSARCATASAASWTRTGRSASTPRPRSKATSPGTSPGRFTWRAAAWAATNARGPARRASTCGC